MNVETTEYEQQVAAVAAQTVTPFNQVLHALRKARRDLEKLEPKIKNKDDGGNLVAALAHIERSEEFVEAAHQAKLKERWDAIAKSAAEQAARAAGGKP